MTSSTVTIETSDGKMNAYLCLPEVTPAPALVVVQEAFGVNPNIKRVCERLAKLGYVAMAPEIFHRTGTGVVLDYGNFPAVMPHFGRLTNKTLETDLGAAHGYLARHAEVKPGQVGVIGFCVGGFGAVLAGLRLPMRTVVAFYAGGLWRDRPNLGLSALIGEVDKLEAPLYGGFGDSDHSIPVADVDALRAELDRGGKKYRIDVYEGAAHGFLCEDRPAYHEPSAKLAWPRVEAWLAETLPL